MQGSLVTSKAKRRPSRESITTKPLWQAKSATETHPSHPTGPGEQKTSREGWNWELSQPLGRSQCQTVPLPEENGAKAGGCWSKPLHGQRGINPHVPRLCTRSESGMQLRQPRSEPLRPSRSPSPAMISRGISSMGTFTRRWRSRILLPDGSMSIPARPDGAAPRHSRGRGRKSPSAPRHGWECQEARSLLQHPLPARSHPGSPPPCRKKG